eukprot:CAMPEP_0178549360 /NCGR_PEP_ID=MMETSP0697-20121206/5685_1 /TAXON_ID=265572 /ORGANISM="Extubocellulus spinifer, Strain CCMP396" /LENGTH=1398 /DNA_ID=CAMNT_0020182091 /DNA_START=166 /DNA_END=4362 /DNA_ORIENTATION=-
MSSKHDQKQMPVSAARASDVKESESVGSEAENETSDEQGKNDAASEAKEMSSDQVALRISLGLCPRCGFARTHAPGSRALLGEDGTASVSHKDTSGAQPLLPSPLTPITDPDAKVYKGYHIPCFGGMKAVMDCLGESTSVRGPFADTQIDGNSNSNLLSSAAASIETVSLESRSSMYQRYDPLMTNLDIDDRKPPPRSDKLTVFQAAPLVYRANCTDGDRGWKYVPIEMLDFEREREVLTGAFRDARERLRRAEIELVFETATTERFNAVLAARDAQAIHFTCHASAEYLCLEDGRGEEHLLKVGDLTDLMTGAAACGEGEAPGHKIEFVFVSACYSRAAGEAFVKAGVPHVVCCQQNEPLMDQAAIEFSRQLYLALACGRSVRDAFDLARRSVLVSPDVPFASNEVKKFLLLPEKTDHGFQLFSNRQRSPSDTSTAHGGSEIISMTALGDMTLSWVLPPPPKDIVGRELDMYKIISYLSNRRLIKIKGAKGVGKCGLVAALANYISIRRRSLLIDEIIWLPIITAGGRHDAISAAFLDLFAIFLEDEGLALHMPHDSRYREVSERIFGYLQDTRSLVIVETRPFLIQDQIEKLAIFLNQLFRGTIHTRVLLVSQEGLDVNVSDDVVQSEVVLDALSFGHTITLFGRLCPHVSERRDARIGTPKQLVNVLVPGDEEEVKVKLQKLRKELSKKEINIFTELGGGNAADIHHSAMNMSAEDYDALIASVDFSLDCTTRIELEQKITKLNENLQVAVREQNFGRAKEIQAALNDSEIHREELRTLYELRESEETLLRDIERACLVQDYAQAEALSEELDGVKVNIEAEEKALAEYKDSDAANDAASSNTVFGEGKKHATRAGLELQIRSRRDELEKSIELRDFASCREIQEGLEDLEAMRESLPTLSEISHRIASLVAGIDEAVAARNFSSAQQKDEEMQQLQKQAALEKASEGAFISAVTIRVAKQLLSLGEQLENAVKESDTSRSNDIEQAIREEIRQIEVKFTLDYGSSEEHSGDNVDGDSEIMPHPGDAPREGRGHGHDDDWDDMNGLGKGEQTGIQSHTTARTALNSVDSRPGAFAVAGLGSSSHTGSVMPLTDDLVGGKLQNESLAVATEGSALIASNEEANTADHANTGSATGGLERSPLSPSGRRVEGPDQSSRPRRAHSPTPEPTDRERDETVTSRPGMSGPGAFNVSSNYDRGTPTITPRRGLEEHMSRDPPTSGGSVGVSPGELVIPAAYAVDYDVGNVDDERVARIVQQVMSDNAVEATHVAAESRGSSVLRKFRRKIFRRKRPPTLPSSIDSVVLSSSPGSVAGAAGGVAGPGAPLDVVDPSTTRGCIRSEDELSVVSGLTMDQELLRMRSEGYEQSSASERPHNYRRRPSLSALTEEEEEEIANIHN